MTEQPGGTTPPTSPAPPAANDLRTALGTVLSDPALAPLPDPTATSGLTDERLGQIFTEYQAAPDDRQAVSLLMRKSVGLAKAEITAETVKQENASRTSRRLSRINEVVSDAVKREAPDVDLDLFWSYGVRTAEAECPATLTDYAARLDWQARRAIELVRAKTGRSGGRPRSGGPGSGSGPGGTRSMVEQMRARQDPLLRRP